jgi:hypothetical protein
VWYNLSQDNHNQLTSLPQCNNKRYSETKK